jgi:hypothetical protein
VNSLFIPASAISESNKGRALGGYSWRPSPLATFRAGHLEEFTIKLDASADPPLADHKVIRQRNYEGYTKCTKAIRGHQAVIQSFREPHVIFMEWWYPAFAVHAVCDLRAGRILRYDGTTPAREGQKELLAILRTLEFTR